MGTNNNARCVVTIPLKVEPWQSDVMEKRFEIARSIYNAMLGYELKQYKKMLRDKDYIASKEVINKAYKASSEKERKAAKKTAEFKEAVLMQNKLLREYGFSGFDFGATAIEFSKHYSENISSKVAQISIGGPMYAAFEKLLFSNGEMVHFKKKGQMRSLVSDAKSGIRLIGKDGKTIRHPQYSKGLSICFIAKGGKPLIMPLDVPKNDYYKAEMLYRDIKQIRLIYKKVKGKYRWYAQLCVVGKPAIRYTKDGEQVNKINEGKLGIYIDTTSVTVAKEDDVFLLYDLHKGIISYKEEIAEIQRQMDASRRSTNPDNYEADGTIKKGIIVDGKRRRLKWVYSNTYIKLKEKAADLNRKEAEVRKLERYSLANKILSLGNEIYINDYPFQAAAMRRKFKEGEELTESGRPKKKKKAGAEIGTLAPAELLVLIDQKLNAAGYDSIKKVKLENIDRSEGYKKYYAKALLNGTM